MINGAILGVIAEQGVISAPPSSWTPAELIPDLWLDATDDETIGFDGFDQLISWTDKSANEYVFSVGSSSHFLQSTINGVQCMRVPTGSSTARYTGDSGSKSLLNGVESFSIYCVFDMQGGDSYRTIFNASLPGTTSARAAIYGRSSGDVEAFGRRVTGDPGQGVQRSVSGPVQAAAIFNYLDAESFVGVDGEYSARAFQTPGSTESEDSAYTAICAHPTGPTSESFNGNIGEYVAVKRILTTLEREKLEGYFAHKWGLTSNLPAGHTYKSSPP